MKAVVKISGKQYLVSEKESLWWTSFLKAQKELTLDALLVIGWYKIGLVRQP